MEDTQRTDLIRYVQKRWGGPHALRLAAGSSAHTTLPTGFSQLDDLLGGGLPVGRIITLRSSPTSGASTIAHTIVATTQRAERVPVYLDASHCYDPTTGARIGVDFDRLTIVQPDDPIEALAAATTLARSGGFDLIVFDSLGDAHQGMLSTWLACMARLLHSAGTTLLLLASTRDGRSTYHGGQALAHYSSLILSARRESWLRGPLQNIIGVRTRLTVVKNKTAPPGGSVELQVHTGTLPSLTSRETETWT